MNGVQLYRQTFSIVSMAQVKGVVLTIRYKYGCVLYLKSDEAWRNGVNGVISATSTSTNTYQDLMYHVITLPARTMSTTNAPTSVNYLKEGTNTIVAPSTDLHSYFHAIVRLMSTHSESHIWEYRSIASMSRTQMVSSTCTTIRERPAVPAPPTVSQ